MYIKGKTKNEKKERQAVSKARGPGPAKTGAVSKAAAGGKQNGQSSMRREAPAQITVFFALTLTMIFAFLLGILESARTQAARLYFTQAVNSAMDSLFSQYHRKLWKDYRLLGLEHYEEKQLNDELEAFLSPYLDAVDCFPQEVTGLTAGELLLLTDLDGELFEREVLDYMEYGLLDTLWDYATAEQMLFDIGEASALDEISDLYEEHTKDAVKLEKAIEEIVRVLERQKESYEEAQKALEDLSGGRFIRCAKEMKQILSELPGRVQEYEKQADRLSEKLSASRNRYEQKQAELSETVRAAMESDIREYESYVESDGERRQEIHGFSERAERGQEFLDMMIDMAEEVEDYIASWEPADEDDELDEEALWAPVKRRFLQYDLIEFGGAAGVADKEKEGFLEQVSTLLKGEVLELLLPAGTRISKEALDLSDAPSETRFSGADGCRLDLGERVVMGDYTLKTLHYYGRDRYGDRPETKGSGHLEAEYVINGKNNDYENLSDTVTTLIALREGLNLIYLFTDTQKQSEARNLAAVITGVAGFTPLIAVVTFFILGVWALGQALCDVRDLLSGGSVPFLHDRNSFYLTLSGLLSIGSSGTLAGTSAGEGEKGLSYKEYLRILLFYGQSSLYEYRVMDMIQMNVKSEQKDFLLDRCIYSLEMTAEAKTAHVLAFMGLLKEHFRLGTAYTVKTETFFSY